MIKKTVIITLLFCFSIVSFAQNAKEARSILDKVAATISYKGGIQAKFSVTSNTFGSTSGTILLKGQKFKAITHNAIIWNNGSTQWTYLKANQEVNVSTPNTKQQLGINPYAFLYAYKQGYSMKMQTTAKAYNVHLTATSKNSVSQMKINVSKSSFTPTKVMLLINGQWTVITISSFKKANLTDKTFQFDAKDYPNAEIIDLR